MVVCLREGRHLSEQVGKDHIGTGAGVLWVLPHTHTHKHTHTHTDREKCKRSFLHRERWETFERDVAERERAKLCTGDTDISRTLTAFVQSVDSVL